MVLPFGLQLVIDNIGIGFEWTVCLVLILGALIFASKSVQISMMALMMTMGGIFVWFYEIGYDWSIPLQFFFIALVILAISLYASSNTSTTGGLT